jgi:hypothetical protein
MLRKTARRNSHVDAGLKGMLGSARAQEAVNRVKAALPLTVKRPLLMRQLGAAALLLIVTGAGFTAKRFWTPVQTPTQLVALTQTPEGDTEVRKANLDLDHWDATVPLRFASTQTVNGWLGPLVSHAKPRPGTESWAVYSIYPDSGEGEIDLVDLNGTRTRLTNSPHDDRPAAFSPDGRQLLILTTRWSSNGWSDIAVLDVSTRRIRRISRGGHKNEGGLWSPDGTRIAYSTVSPETSSSEICIADADGVRDQCRSIPEWNAAYALGWIDPHRLIISDLSKGSGGRRGIYDVDRGLIDASGLPQQMGIALDPSGAWAFVWNRPDDIGEVRIAPSMRFDLTRMIPEDSGRASEFVFMAPRLSDNFVDSIAIATASAPLQPHVPYVLSAQAWSRSRRRLETVVKRWRSLTPSIASVDSLGIPIPTDTGRAIVELSAGGWRRVVDTFKISSVPAKQLVDENWDATWRTRWRTFGEPKPSIVTEGTTRAMLTNGDGNFLSGAYYHPAIDPRHGLSVDFDISTPVTRLQWQIIHVGLQGFSNSNHIERWDHRTGYMAPYVDSNPACSFSYPSGEGERARTGTSWYASMRAAMADPNFQLYDGRWYHVRLQLFPAGRCGIAINGKAVIIDQGLGPPRVPVLPTIQGGTVGTRILVGHLVIRSGVPDDIDWTTLKFDGFSWVRMGQRVSASHSPRSSQRSSAPARVARE